MKKFLSLVLALVMTMSLVTISAGATDFKDDGKINYQEAVSVMSAVKVIDGYADGSFNPQGTLTRGAAAKIICNLILGPTTAAALHANTAPFKDVPVDHTFAGYIAYCSEQGIISGYADGAFRPAATLTNYAFLKMLLGALGYDSEIEGFVGENWSIQVAKRALGIGLTKGYDGTFVGTAAATREEACLYALNTLKATMVDYDAKITASVNGAQIVVGNSLANEVKWNIAAKTDGNIKDDGYVQFAEKYFPSLELEIGNGIYGRPANTWKLKKAEIGTFTSIEPTVVYTEGTKEKDIYKDLGKVICDEKEYDWTAYVNGKEVDAKDVVVPAKDGGEYQYTGEGTVTEIYVNEDDATVTVCEFNYYLGQVAKVKTDDDGEYISVKVLSDGGKTLDDKTFYVEGYEEDDYVVFTVDYNEDDKDFVIGEVCEPETVTGAVTRVDYDKKDSGINASTENNAYLKMDGDKYVYSDAGKADQHKHMVYNVEDLTEKKHPTLDDEYMLFLDPNSYVLGFKLAKETVDQYLFVKDSDEELKDWVAKVVLPDATASKVDLDKELNKTPAGQITVPANEYNNKNTTITFTGKDNIEWIDDARDQQGKKYDNTNIDGLIWKYSVDKKGAYELTYVEVFDSVAGNRTDSQQVSKTNTTQWYLEGAEIENGEAYVTYDADKNLNDQVHDYKNGFIVDKQTVFVDVEGGKVYTGYKEVPNVENAKVAYVLKGKVAEIVFILDGDIYDEGNVYFMIADKDERSSFKYDGKDFWTYEKVYVDGEKTELNIKYGADKQNPADVLKQGELYRVKKTIDEDYITEVEWIAQPGADNVWAVGDEAFWLKGDGETPEKFTCDEETVFVVVDTTADGKLKIFSGDLKDLIVSDKLGVDPEKNDYSACSAVVLEDDDNNAELVYIWRTEVGAKKGGDNGKLNWVKTTYGEYAIEKTEADGKLVGKVYVNDKDRTVSEIYAQLGGTGIAASYYTTENGMRVKKTIDNKSGLTIDSVLEQDSASIVITNASGSWTIVNEK